MKICKICGKDITHKKSNSASKCEKCVRKPNNKSLDSIKLRAKNSKKYKYDVLIAYDVCCAICKWKIDVKIINGKHLHQKGCEIHHIIPIKEGGKDLFENVILLCPNHHKEADLGLIDRNFLLSLIIKNKDEIIKQKKFELLCHANNIISSLF